MKLADRHKINLNASHIFTHRPYVSCAFGPINKRSDARGTTASQGRPLTSSGHGGSRSWKSSDKPILWSFVSIFPVPCFSLLRTTPDPRKSSFSRPSTRFSLPASSSCRDAGQRTSAADLYLHQVIAPSNTLPPSICRPVVRIIPKRRRPPPPPHATLPGKK